MVNFITFHTGRLTSLPIKNHTVKNNINTISTLLIICKLNYEKCITFKIVKKLSPIASYMNSVRLVTHIHDHHSRPSSSSIVVPQLGLAMATSFEYTVIECGITYQLKSPYSKL